MVNAFSVVYWESVSLYWVSVGGEHQKSRQVFMVRSCFKNKYKRVLWKLVVDAEVVHEIAWSGRSGKELSLMSPARDTTLEAGSV